MEEFCNQCPNHCPVSALRCPRGRAYFEQNQNAEGNEQVPHQHGRGRGHSAYQGVLGQLAACGHFLYHGAHAEQETLLKALAPQEQEELERLLSKLLDSWRESFPQEKMGRGGHGHR